MLIINSVGMRVQMSSRGEQNIRGMMKKHLRSLSVWCLVSIGGLLTPMLANAQSFTGLYSQPLVGNASAAPLFLLTMQRDARLFVEAYDDASDINGDGVMDVKYNPALKEYDPVAKAYKSNTLDYFGYFDSYKCYQYDKTNSRFIPIGDTDTDTKKCTGTKDSTGFTKPWSGDFLNYLTTTRIDALRKVFYGGSRSTDTAYSKAAKSALTVLERANIPQDLHAFGKEYNSVAIDGYDISEYTPLPVPVTGKRHMFANVTLEKTTNNKPPLLRVLKDSSDHIWDWVAAETTSVASNTINGVVITPVDFTVRVVVCDNDQLPTQGVDQFYCKKYGSGYKPTGILHTFGENNSAYFGLLTGSYINNFSGGVLRRAIASFTDEVNATNGLFKDPASNTRGIVYTMDHLQVRGFDGGYTNSQSVGNPIAEMMYEGLRYLAGNTACTAAGYCGGIVRNSTTGLSNEDPPLPILKAWTNPYGGSGFNVCAKPTQMVLSDVNPTKDSDELAGAQWGSSPGALGTLNVSTLSDKIWNAEGMAAKNLIIGELSGATTDVGLPTAKLDVSGFSKIRGLVPEDPGLGGGYYSAAVAKFGKETDLKTLGNPAFSTSTVSNRVVDTVAVALSSAQPRIEIPYMDTNGNKSTLSVLPFARTYTGGTPAWKIADFVKSYVVNVKNISLATMDPSINGGRPYYKLKIVFSDTSMYNGGNDNDMDAIAVYEVFVAAGDKLVVNVCADPDPSAPVVDAVQCNGDGSVGKGYSATGVTVMHLGYSVYGVKIPSGEKPVRLVVRNSGYNTQVSDFEYAGLDLPSARISGAFSDNYFNTSTGNTAGIKAYVLAADSKSLRLNHTQQYDIGSSTNTGEFVPHDPLWYAAKYGGYSDLNDNQQLDGTEWISDDGITPIGYYKVTNAALLKTQLEKAVAQKVLPPGSFAAVASNSTDLKTLTAVYQGRYLAKYWSGQLLAYSINVTAGTVDTTTPLWNAATKIPASGRNVFTYRLSNSATAPTGIAFNWATLNTAEKTKLGSDSTQLDYIVGDRSKEGSTFRVRDPDTVLGDIVNSQPVFAGSEDLGYALLSGPAGASYKAFVDTTKKTRPKMVYVGANDGMLHGFGAADGVEKFAYIPRATLWGDNASQLSSLTSKTYTHKYFVDGPTVVDDYYNGSTWKSVLIGAMGGGGKSIFALDVTDPSNFVASSVKWEFSHPELGYVKSRPVIARLNDGNWYVIVGNGFESDTCNSASSPRYEPTTSSSRLPLCNDDLPGQTRNAKLFIIKLDPGDLSNGWKYGINYFVIDVTNGQDTTTSPSVSAGTYSNGSDNGLAGPAVLNGMTNTAVNYIYSGDLQGNVWKLDLSNTNPSSWTTAYKLYQATDSSGVTQPITSALAVATNPNDSTASCVSVGTGRFVYDGDLIYNGVQSLYGLMDKGSSISTVELQEYKIVDKKKITVGTKTSNVAYISNEAFVSTNKGWRLDLIEPATVTPRNIGERVIQSPIQVKLRSNELLSSFLTSIPTGDKCEASGVSYQLDFNACTGEGLSTPTFDLNGDGAFTGDDKGSAPDGERVGGVQVGAADENHTGSALCFESGTGGVKGCQFDLAILSCTDGRIETIKKPPTLTCGVSRTSWRQIR